MMSETLNEIIFKLTKFILILSSKLANLDLCQYDGNCKKGRRRKSIYQIHQCWFSNLSFAIQSYCTIKIVIVGVIQCIYDFKLLKYKKYATKMSITQVEELEASIRSYENILNILGCSLIKFNFAAEGFYMYLTMFWILVFFGAIWYFTKKRPLDFGLVRALLDEAIEAQNCKLLMAKEVENFINSTETYYYSRLESSRKKSRWNRMNLMREKEETIRSLQSIISRKCLFPLNRTKSWLQNFARFIVIGFNILFIGTNLFILAMVYQISDEYWPTWSLMNIISIWELLTLILFITCEAAFLYLLNMAATYDLLFASIKLLDESKSRQREDESIFYAIQNQMKYLKLDIDSTELE